MTTSASWSDKPRTIRKREHFFWWPNTVTFWDGGAPREYTYFWETVTLTEECCKGGMGGGNFWKVIAVNNQPIA